MPFKTIGVKVDGTFTDIVLGSYENKLLIVVTQTQKFGSILRIEKEIFQALNGQENVFSVQTIFGKEDDQVSLFARILCERIESAKPVILIANLKVRSSQTLRGLIQVINENKIW